MVETWKKREENVKKILGMLVAKVNLRKTLRKPWKRARNILTNIERILMNFFEKRLT